MHGRQRSLLIAEDDSNVRSIFAEIFSERGYRVLEASNGAEAYAMLLCPDVVVNVVLTDLRMPVMDGLEFASKVKNDTQLSAIPIVLLSATPLPNSWQARQIFDALLVKPCPLPLLISTVETVQIAQSGDAVQSESPILQARDDFTRL
ncbi:receiver domain-containing protein [Herbaspirillum frisingense GSF30]|uniref:Receiver domain-containing protein n=1 Tax=Herbaspirillum frisingense GSF30 TaxID=864073 RepID=A0AAI9IDF7_9BURK|nr:response regulator [Herbaspirillum frisingense]EOA03964.1 receiver domain-containing protein [Herbaspirillum frisingense GSF30]